MLTTHPAYTRLQEKAKAQDSNIHQGKILCPTQKALTLIWNCAVLQELLEQRRVEKKAESLTELTKDMHFYPDLHGRQFRKKEWLSYLFQAYR